MKYMAYMIGESKTRIEEVVIFGDSPSAIRNSENYTDFQSDGYTEESMYSLECVSGSDSALPGYISGD